MTVAESKIPNPNHRRFNNTLVHDFPTSQATVAGGNDQYTVPFDAMCFFEIEFSNMEFSQISVFVNGISLRGSGMISSGKSNLNGHTMIIPFPVSKGDVISVGFYSSFTVQAARARLIYS